MRHHNLLLVDPKASRRCALASRLVDYARVIQVGDAAAARTQFLQRRPRMVLLSMDQDGSHGPGLALELRQAASWAGARVIGVYHTAEGRDDYVPSRLRRAFLLDFVVAAADDEALLDGVAAAATSFSTGVPGHVVPEPPRITPSRWRRLLTEPVTAYTIRSMLRAS